MSPVFKPYDILTQLAIALGSPPIASACAKRYRSRFMRSRFLSPVLNRSLTLTAIISTPLRNGLRDHTKQNQREPNSSSSIFVHYRSSLVFQGYNVYSKCRAGQIFIVINYDRFINKFVVKKDYPWSASHVLQRKDPSCLNQQVQNITTTTKQKREDSTRVSSLFYPLFESFIMIMYFHIIIFSYILIFRLFIQGTLFALNQIPSSLKAFRCSSQPSC